MMKVLGLLLACLVVACGDTASTSASVTTAAPISTAAPASTAAPTTVTTAPAATTTPAATTAPPTVTTSTVDPNAPVVIEVDVYEGQVAGGGRFEVDKDDIVQLTVRSDTSDEVHIHGYDIYGDVGAGGAVTLEFIADIQGIFEVELEGARLELLELVVN